MTGREYFWKMRDMALDWVFVRWVRAQTRMPVILKGVLHPLDVVTAAQMGVDAVWLSNHGGRQLDTAVPAAYCIKACRKALKDEGLTLPLLVDGGIRKGTDILKCLALGADHVFIGRAYVYGLVNGAEGVKKVIDILAEELIRAMQLAGIASIEEAGSLSLV
jgi:isopentenyl diphosphate isomerase/L-lactate dehydrogenase-like FMN-dependent dehydrogenase